MRQIILCGKIIRTYSAYCLTKYNGTKIKIYLIYNIGFYYLKHKWNLLKFTFGTYTCNDISPINQQIPQQGVKEE